MVNENVSKAMNALVGLDSGRGLTLTCEANRYSLYNKGEEVAVLSLPELRLLSREAGRLGVVQLVDVSDLVQVGRVRGTDGYLKIRDDIAEVFLHLLGKLKFQKRAQTVFPVGVA